MRAPWGKFGALLAAAIGMASLSSCILFEKTVSIELSTEADARTKLGVFVDVTGDGVDDPVVVVAEASEDRLVRLDRCGGSCLEARESIDVPSRVDDLDAADLDGDGTIDIVVATGAGTVVYWGGRAVGSRPAGLVPTDRTVVSAHPWSSAAIGTFDDTAGLDLALSDVDTYAFVAGTGPRTFAAPVDIITDPAGTRPVGSVFRIDIDGDGKDEVAVGRKQVSTRQAELEVYRNRSTLVPGFFVGEQTSSAVAPDITLAAGDFTGDGQDDAVVTFVVSPAETNTVFLRSTGTGAVFANGPRNLNGARQVAIGDFEGDDLFAARSNVGAQAWAYAHPTGSGFGPAIFKELGNAVGVAIGKGDGDDLPDVVLLTTSNFAKVAYLDNRSFLPD